MVKHDCDICQYLTTNKSNYNKHIKSKKHKLKLEAHVPENYVKNMDENKVLHDGNEASKNSEKQRKTRKNAHLCADCGVTFTRSHSLSKHISYCIKRLTNDKTLELERKLQEKEKQLREQNIEKEYYKELINNYSKLGPKTFNSITYVMNKYENAPHIKKIEPEKIEYFQNINMTKVENMISDYRNDRFVTFIINTIITLHKKENPEDQSIWSTDSSRYNYLIKELLENEDSYWIIDKKGAKSQDYLIEPILRFIRNAIIKYNALAGKALMNEQLPKNRFSIISDTQKYGIDIIRDIDDGLLGADIIRKMAKHFHHKSKNVPLIEEVE